MRCLIFLALLSLHAAQVFGQNGLLFADDFSKTPDTAWQAFGPGYWTISDSELHTQDSKLATAGSPDWKNYELKFRAHAPQGAYEAQIWAGIRVQNRHDRYVLGLRGGNHDDLLFWRQGWLGQDEFLATRPLDFHPETGQWFTIRLLACDDHFLVFLGDEALPRIHVRDSAAHFSTGKIALGGGWFPAKFDDVEVRQLELPEIERLKILPEANFGETPEQKETRRKAERAKYLPKTLTQISTDAKPSNESSPPLLWRGAGGEVTLDGDWLFLPDYQLLIGNETAALSPDSSDENWHILAVPNFWNEHRVWLHGEDAMMLSGDKGASDNLRQTDDARCAAYTFDFRKTNIGYYRQWLVLPDSGFEMAEKSVRLRFEAVSKMAKIWVNGHPVGEHVGMFAPFEFEVGQFLRPGRNLLVVKVVKNYAEVADGEGVVDLAESVGVTKKMLADLPHGIFAHEPAGIWQGVKLLTSNRLRLRDVFVKTHLTGLDLDLEIEKSDTATRQVSLDLSLVDCADGTVLFSQKGMAAWSLAGDSVFKKSLSLAGLQPKLWSPEHPNLYSLELSLHDSSLITHSSLLTKIGFRTFEKCGEFFCLNGRPYRPRGANHTPFSVRPNDPILADTFLKKMHDAGFQITRTTTAPFNEIWLEAADRQGVAVSFEGAFPWLMMRGDIPDSNLLNVWRREFFDLVRRARNHPSVLFWTVNNEMKFYEKDTVRARVQHKFQIVSDVVKSLRKFDPTRPVIFDSGYRRDTAKFDRKFMAGIDDGDADDIHNYFNWYYFSVFDLFDSTFTRWYKNRGRPLITQEFSSGYPNNDSGHPVRFYTFAHDVPQALVGQWAFEDHDPRYFLERQAFIAKEGAEALRRSTPSLASFQAFSSVCWWQNVFDTGRMKPFPVVRAMQLAEQPVLVSAELFGRHFWAGDTLRARVCVLNDAADGRDLPPTFLRWRVENQGVALTSGLLRLPSVPYFSQHWDSLVVRLPDSLRGRGLVRVQLVLELTRENQVFSKNEYDLLLAESPNPKAIEWRDWGNNIAVFNPPKNFEHGILKACDANNSVEELTEFSAIKDWAKIPVDEFKVIVEASKLTHKQLKKLRRLIKRGGQVILLHAGENAHYLFPQLIDSVLNKPGEMVQLLVPEHPIFEGVGPLDLAWLNNGKQERPISCPRAYYVHPQPNVEPLAQFTVTHGAINPAFHKRHERVREFTGFPLVDVHFGKGRAMLCELNLEFAATDPVAGMILATLLRMPR